MSPSCLTGGEPVRVYRPVLSEGSLVRWCWCVGVVLEAGESEGGHELCRVYWMDGEVNWFTRSMLDGLVA